MGSVQRLATIVVLGLVGLASVLILYLADESNRIDQFAVEQQEAAIERGQATYLTQCLSCHGPAGEGYTAQGEGGTGRKGAALGGINTELNQTGLTADGLPWSDPNNPQFGTGMTGRFNFIVNRVHNGYRPDGTTYVMPPFGSNLNGPLNDAQIQELATFIQHADWNEVYNAAVEQNGGYPTAPPAPTATGAAEGTEQAGGDTGSTAAFEIDLQDIKFDPSTLEIPAGQDVVVNLVNTGALPHNFSIPDQGISVDVAAGATEQVTLNLPAGTYDFDCNVPGHKEAGMVGKITAVEGMEMPGGDTGTDTGASTPDAGSGGDTAAATEIEIDLQDIKFDPADVQIPAGQDVTVHLVNSGALPHNFSIPDQGISQDVAAGATETITLNLPAGTYDFDCNVPGHKEAGMVGKITASDAAPPATDGNETPAAEGTPAPDGEGAVPTGPIEIDLADIKFVPSEFSIPADTDTTITLKNTGALPHTFTIPDTDYDFHLAAGETQEVTINLPAGDYSFDCVEVGHKEAGMVGTLHVGGAAPATGGDETSAAAEGTPAPDGQAAIPTGPIEIDLADIKFVPSEFSIPADTDTTITLKNTGALPHTFTIPDTDYDFHLAAGETQEVTINLPAGDYSFDCVEVGHKEAGMVGTLHVGGAAPAGSPVASPQASPEGSPVAGGPIEIDLVDIKFEPSELTIPANTDVKITLKNTGALPHTFTIPNTDYDFHLAAGETQEVTINLAAGEYPFDCVEVGHKEAGMVGTLTVK